MERTESLFLNELNLKCIFLQPALHVLGQTIYINVTRIGITENCRSAVIARRNDITLVVTNVKHIVTR